jgi:hypothetical protein
MRRLVEVYVVDPDRNLPVEKSIVYQSGRIMTDSTDSDLFFESGLLELLAKHNEIREKTTVMDKYQGKKIPLEPIKISDLNMTVVTIASF